MKKMTALISLLFILTVSSFLVAPKLMKLIVRIQRPDDPSSITTEDLLQKIEPVLLATVQFDQQKIEFYYDIDLIENNGLYYKSHGKNQVITYPQNFINSSDGKLRFYADFANEYEFYEDGQFLEPYHILEVQIGSQRKTIPLYQLDKTKEVRFRTIGLEEEYSFACSVHELCSHIEEMYPDELDSFFEEWKQSSWPDGITYKDLQSLFYIEENMKYYDFTSGHTTSHIIGYKYVQDKKGTHYIIKETTTNTFYEVSQSQLDQFYSFLRNYPN